MSGSRNTERSPGSFHFILPRIPFRPVRRTHFLRAFLTGPGIKVAWFYGFSIFHLQKTQFPESEATAAGLCHPNCTHSFVAVGEFVQQEDFTADGRPKEGVNSPGKEEKDDKEAWQKYRNSLKPQKAKKGPSAASKKKSAPTTPATAKPAAKATDKPAKGTPAAVQPELTRIVPGSQNGKPVKLGFSQHFHSQPLSEEEQKAIRRYSGSIYSDFNHYLRNLAEHPNIKRNPDFDSMAKNLNSAIDKSIVTHDVIVYRGIGSRRLRILYEKKPPTEIPINFFQSTSSVKKVARRFAEGQIMMMIHIPKDSHSLPIKKYSLFSRENENLLKNSGIFKVLKQYHKDGMLYLEVEYVEHQ